MNKRRVVITGIGVISPNGIGKKNAWEGFAGGKSGVRLVDGFDVSVFNTKIAAEVRDFDPFKLGLSHEEAMRMDRYVQFGVAAGKMAVEDSRLDFSQEDVQRIGVCLANAICGTKYMEEEFALVTDDGKKPIDPSLVRPDLYDAAMFNTPSIEISARFGLKGSCNTISTGCTAGTDSLGFGLESIQDGSLDVMICGAAEAPLTPITFGAFDVVNVLSVHNAEPQKASRPFDNKRDGFVLGEGAGILVLEELNHALKRNASIYCEILGFGTSCNAFHMTDLPSDGRAMETCIALALKDAQVKPSEIDYINAHGSSTRMNDIFESNAYKAIFGEAAHQLPISSFKSMIGHPLAAANAIEMTIASMIFEKNILPPTINQEEKDPQCDLYYIPNEAIQKKVNIILKTSSGFSGIHSSLVLKRFKE
ncbi:MAG: beta-ketoacyl-[acyl-carrier-protein] synthase family protein [Candidatus Omnitrophica bacterium]|nr:beta-ketoacyl-[acyl-carrier-protein] synthase family protein [Candidatus Omnitrophota bacterium]MBU4303070.1 beta-ketoacyl-[acyl-carrier-protein] synthase family protein [Candidatus Omnitrophota bacterium]MBU4468561.1 beta-ketoacyl-[acyl-carrier-protein] synthase family protein [Candidatus Omnitrophota bacterium]MCG2708146.1 beta-ketoacyl-[acyl-carrier-protein] synthase family protein [Candidatus Omnitrophota bacterium]